MGDTIIFGEESGSKESREAAEQAGLPNTSVDVADVKTFVDEYTKFTKVSNWETMNLSTAQGAALANAAYTQGTFDGRYVYFTPASAVNFLRFDTEGQFTTAGDWEQMSASTAQGADEVSGAYARAEFDGRYIYFSPLGSVTFLRFDTKGTSFTTTADWQTMSMSTVQGASAAAGASSYISAGFDGRFIYFAPYNEDTFIRFDTQGTSFTTEADWQKMSMSTAQGATALSNAYRGGGGFDGQYIYFAAWSSDTFLRFNTKGTSFSTEADWDQMSMSTAQGGTLLDAAYSGVIFDGRYIHFATRSADTFIRFDTQGTSFTTAGDWSQMSMSTALGALVDNAFNNNIVFDNRYVYFSAYSSLTFVRFDTQGTSFATTADWQIVDVADAQGAAAVASNSFGAIYDGKYVYFPAFNSDTFLRVLASPSTLKP